MRSVWWSTSSCCGTRSTAMRYCSSCAQKRYPVRAEDAARLSPFGHEHINLLGRYSFAVPDSVARGELRPNCGRFVAPMKIRVR